MNTYVWLLLSFIKVFNGYLSQEILAKITHINSCFFKIQITMASVFIIYYTLYVYCYVEVIIQMDKYKNLYR